MSDIAFRRRVVVLLPLSLTLLLALLLRVVGLTRSLGHDEIYTWVIFSSQPFGDILTSYHLPNNHILHTLCVRFAAAILGDAEWALRLPALLAGLLAVAALYGCAWRLTGSRDAAVWSALLLSLSDVHVGFSKQARGYTLLVLLCVVFVWALVAALESYRRSDEPPPVPWWPWVVVSLSGCLAVLTVPSGVLLVGAGLLGAAGLLRWEVPSEHRVGAQVALLLSAVAVAAFTTAVYAPLIDDVQAHAQRFGVPLSLGTLPGWVADVWAQVGPHRWSVVFAVVTAAGAVRLAVVRRAHGVLLIALLLVPFLLSLALSTGGAPRTYVFLLPFVCIGLGVAAAGVEERLLRWLPAAAWTRAVAGCAVLLLLAAGFSRGPLSSAPETGYRRAGRFVAESTAPGDVVVVPYIVDSAVGYYSDGATVQRLREAVAGGLRRLLFLTRPGTPRFELADLMLATNFTTDAGHHADTYRNWRLPTDAFDSVSRFDRVEILEPAQPLRPAALPDLLRPDSWSLYYQSHPQATTWFPVPHPGHSARSALQVRVSNEAPAVLHSTQTFTCEADGLALLAYCKQGGGYASLYERRGGDVRALQMATPLSAPASVPTDTGPLFTELYLRPVRAGAQYGVYVTAAEDLTLCDWAVYTVPYTPTPLR